MKKYIFFAAAALALASCSNDEPAVNTGNGELKVTANLSSSRMSRANGANWEADAIGVMVTGSTSGMDAMYKNVKYTTTSTGTTADFAPEGNGIFFQDANETVTFAAYAPYQTSSADNALPGDAADGVIAASTAAQSTRELQKAFDFIYASGATASRASSTVNLAFSHVMTKLTIVVKPGKDITLDDIKAGNFTLSGLKHDGSFDVTTGVAEASGEVTTAWSLSDNAIKSEGTDGVAFTAILLPQTPDAALRFTATVDGQTYTNNAIRPDLAAGNAYTYNITVNKTGLTVGSCTVTDWDETPAVDIDAEMPNPYGEAVSVDEAAVGDIILTNGVIIKGNTITEEGKRIAGAVVYYAGHNEDDTYDYSATPIGSEKCHGYAMALQEYKLTSGWGVSGIDLKNYLEAPDVNPDRDIIYRHDWRGYYYTQLIIDAAGGKDKLSATELSGYPATYCAVVEHQKNVPAPSYSTGWFLPSIGQMFEMDLQNDLLIAAGGTELDFSGGHWTSSSPYDYDQDRYVLTFFRDGLETTGSDVWMDYKHYKHYGGRFVRPVLAF